MPHAPLSPLWGYGDFIEAVIGGIHFLYPGARADNIAIESLLDISRDWHAQNIEIRQLNNLRQLYDLTLEVDSELVGVQNLLAQGFAGVIETIGLLIPGPGPPDFTPLVNRLLSIDSNLVGVWNQIAHEGALTREQIVDAEHVMIELALQNIIPEIRAVATGMTLPLDELVGLIMSFIHPDLLSIAQTLGIELSQIRAVLLALLQALGVGDPDLESATREVAERTEVSGLAASTIQSLMSLSDKPDADAYADWLTTSGPFAAILGKGVLGTAMKDALRQTLKLGAGATLADLAVQQATQGKVNMQIADNVFWALGRGRETVIPLVSKVLAMASDAISQLSEPLHALMFPLFKNMIGAMEGFVGSTGHVPPHGGFDKAKEFLLEAGRLGTQAHLTAVLFEMIPWAKHFGVTQASAFLADMAAFGPIASATWGQAIGEGVGRPSKYQISAIMRSRIPDERDLEELLIKRVISEEQFRNFMAFHGYLPEYVDALATKAFRDPRLSEIIRLAQEASIDENEVFNWIRRAGFSDDDATRMLPPIMSQAMRAERGRLISEVMTNLHEGFLTDEEANIYFERLSIPAKARGFLFDTARLSFRRDLITEHQKTLERALASGLMNEGQFALGMSALGIRPEKASAVAARIDTERTAKVAQEERREVEKEIREHQHATIARLKEQFEIGLLDRNLFRLFLIAVGIVEQVADEIVILEELRLAGRNEKTRVAEAEQLREQIVRFRTAAFVELFRQEQITASQLQAFLLQLGHPLALANAIVEREQALKVVPPTLELNPPAQVRARELRIRAKESLTIRFRKGVIDADTLLRAFVDLGIDVAIAAADVDLEIQRRRKEVQPPPAPTVDPEILASRRRQISDVEKAYEDGRVDEDTLRSLLLELVTDPEVLSALVEEAFLARALKLLPVAGSA